MAVATIIKNVYTFAKILYQAGTDIIHQWDTKSVENAFNWARYCEKVEEQTREKSFCKQLDQQLQSLTLLLTPVTLLDVSLDTLKHASTHLARVLLGCPYLSDELRKVVQLELANSGEQDKILASSRDNRETPISSRALHSLLGYDLSTPDTSEGKGGIVIKRLARLKKATDNKQRYDAFFEEFLHQLTNLCQGWEILLYVLLTDVESEADHWDIEEIKGEILHWVIQHSDITSSSLWSVDGDLLLAVCSRDDQFYQLYRNSVIQWAANMEPVYGFTEEGDLYKWCYGGKDGDNNCSCENNVVRQCLCYNCLVRHVHRLRCDENVKLNFEKTIRGLSEQTHFNIWADILKSVKERLK